MRNRLFMSKPQENDIPLLACLNGSDVITAKISDHHPIIHDGVLFWNVMMQGRMRKNDKGTSFNNGFGFVEDDVEYKFRLAKAALVIAEIILQNPNIETIGLCEGPIQASHISILRSTLMQFKCMHRFTLNNQDIKGYQNWGLLMLTDNNNHVTPVRSRFNEQPIAYASLANRVQLWKLTNKGKDKYIALAHFPFAGDEHVTDKFKLSQSGKMYCQLVTDLMERYANEHFVMCADFNFNPYLIGEWKSHAIDKIIHHNSILLTGDKTIKTVTVDGVLLSIKEKQKHALISMNNLFGRLAREYCLFKSYIDKHLVDHVHKNLSAAFAK